MKKILCLAFTLALGFGLAACGSSGYKDGSYTGVYVNEEGRKTTSEVVIKIVDGKIVEASYTEKDDQNRVKAEEYGKEAGEQKYQLAQKAVAGMKEYPKALVEYQDLEKVDAVSGATTSYLNFKEAAQAALDQAK